MHFARPDWQKAVALESKAVRERAGIMDISAFTKVEVSGPDAEKLLDRLIANRLPQKMAVLPLPICSTGAAGSNWKRPWFGWLRIVSIWFARPSSSNG